MNQPIRLATRALRLTIAILACCNAGSALAATASANSTSVVVTPIAITKATDLSFGQFAAGGTSGTVVVTPNGSRSFTGGAVGAGGTSAAAKFNVTGEAGLTYAVTIGGSTQLTNGANTMAFAPISDTSASAITSGNVTSGVLAGGAQSIYVGGTLTVGANQVTGTYTGNVTATVDYN